VAPQALLRPHYELLASLFVYPSADYPQRAVRVVEGLRASHPEAAASLDCFISFLPPYGSTGLGLEALYELQEIYTRSFEVQAITTLDVGYVCFGDDYKRAEMLVNLNREHRGVGVDCGFELSDHLPNVLRLLARWTDEPLAQELVQQIVTPAVRQMIAEFDPQRMAQRNALYKKHHKTLIESSVLRATMFHYTLVAVATTLEADFGFVESELPNHSTDFLRSIKRELEIEDRGAGARPSAQLGNGLPRREHAGPGRMST